MFRTALICTLIGANAFAAGLAWGRDHDTAGIYILLCAAWGVILMLSHNAGNAAVAKVSPWK